MITRSLKKATVGAALLVALGFGTVHSTATGQGQVVPGTRAAVATVVEAECVVTDGPFCENAVLDLTDIEQVPPPEEDQ